MDLETEKVGLFLRDAEWSAAAFEGKDVERVLSYWTDDAIIMPPGRPSIVGKDANRQFVSASFQTPGFSIRWETSDAIPSPDGTMAYLISRNFATHLDKEGKAITSEGRAVTIWRKDTDGEWRCAVDIWNADAAV